MYTDSSTCAGVGGGRGDGGYRHEEVSLEHRAHQKTASCSIPEALPRHRRPEARKEGLNTHLPFPLRRESCPHPGVSSTSVGYFLGVREKSKPLPPPPRTDCTSDGNSLGSCLSESSRTSPSIQHTAGA